MTDKTSVSSLAAANADRAEYSKYKNAIGAAGYLDPADDGNNADFLGRRGDSLAVSPDADGGFGLIKIGAAWDARTVNRKGFLNKLLKGNKKKVNIDLDLGCLYELQDGSRGAVQAFGNLFGAFDTAPYLSLSGDERTGDAEGLDEYIKLNGKKWADIKRILVYVYIYSGSQDWAGVKPQVQVHVPNHKPMVVTLASHQKGLSTCAIAGLENVRGGIKLTNYTEYFPGHAEMDRAYGFGLEWDEGKKD